MSFCDLRRSSLGFGRIWSSICVTYSGRSGGGMGIVGGIRGDIGGIGRVRPWWLCDVYVGGENECRFWLWAGFV